MSSMEIKDYNFVMDGQNPFDQLIKSNMRRYNNILKITLGQRDNYTAGCLLSYLLNFSSNWVGSSND